MNEQVVVEKLKVEKNPSLKIVADYLKDHCVKEPTFIEKVLSEKKTINECWEYIKSQAKKQAENGCACISDSEVFGWALHYFDEENLEDWKTVKEKVKTTTVAKEDYISEDDNEESEETDTEEEVRKPKKEVIKKVEPNPAPTPVKVIKKPKGVAENQISLFD